MGSATTGGKGSSEARLGEWVVWRKAGSHQTKAASTSSPTLRYFCLACFFFSFLCYFFLFSVLYFFLFSLDFAFFFFFVFFSAVSYLFFVFIFFSSSFFFYRFFCADTESLPWLGSSSQMRATGCSSKQVLYGVHGRVRAGQVLP